MAQFIITTKNTRGGPNLRLRYDNDTSELLNDETGKPIVSTLLVAPITSEAFKVSVDNPANKVSPRKLKISLGLSCNYECEYCSQRFVPRADETNPAKLSHS